MGSCQLTNRNDPNSIKSKCIDHDLKKYANTLHNQVKLLLLCPGESGKSTVFKQMKIIQDMGGFSHQECLTFKSVIHANCISQMQVLINAAAHLQIQLGSEEAVRGSERLLQCQQQGGCSDGSISNTGAQVELAGLIKMLWADKGIQTVFGLRGKRFQLNDSAAYFFEHVDRISREDYVPTPDDVLRARIRSTGIEEAEFTFEKLTFTMVDVGGQRSERRKWIHCFEKVTAILFCAAMSEYDQTLREDSSQNRVAEALLLFDEVSNLIFCNNTIILFLNKVDLFDEKITRIPLTECFPDYPGTTAEEAKAYIKQHFLAHATNKDVYVHFTCALNTDNIQIVIKSIREQLLKGDFQQMGIGGI